MIHVRSLDHLVLMVRDLEASLGFYHGLLGLPVENLEAHREGKSPFVSVRIGASLLDLFPDSSYDAEAHAGGGLLHFCVTVDGDIGAVVAELSAAGVSFVDDEPAQRLGARGVGPSVYARDPDGYIVEIKAH